MARDLLLSDAELVVFEGAEWPAFQLAQLCASQGKRVVAVRCDRFPGPLDDYFDATVVPTAGLAKALGIRRAIVIEDVVDVPPEVAKTSYASLPGPIKVVWFGHQGYECFIVGWAEKLREELGDSFSFEVISTGAFATRQWSEQTIVDDLLDCDIAVLPIPVGEWFANKSSNRLAMLFSLAMPTVASPIHSYREIGVHGVNVLFADPDGFGAALRTLIDPAYREKLGAQARRTVGQRFSVDAIAPQWLDRLQAIERVPRRNLKASAFAAVLKLAGAWSAPLTSR